MEIGGGGRRRRCGGVCGGGARGVLTFEALQNAIPFQTANMYCK